MANAIPFLLQIFVGCSAPKEKTVKKKDRETVNQIIQENNKKIPDGRGKGTYYGDDVPLFVILRSGSDVRISWRSLLATARSVARKTLLARLRSG